MAYFNLDCNMIMMMMMTCAVADASEQTGEVQWTESTASNSNQTDQPRQLAICRRSSSTTNLSDHRASSQPNSAFHVDEDQRRRSSCDAAVTPEPPAPPIAAEPPPLVPILGRRLTETAETIMLGMQARIASRATERSRALRARQRRHERRQEQKAAKTLSAILLAFIVTWTPYNVFAIVQTFCADCVDQRLYEFGQSVNTVLTAALHRVQDTLFVILCILRLIIFK